ncbi:hypothetical protein OQJ59_03480 [Microbulbifer thermotolerans]|uniref:hypothetical protein n=1 Tax=Microbulbifer thermotolerans TaxID=252514 RepID=UPI00224A681D|nr:hypothetical protein [Microbulbifer thermotolerans]MCX2840673.1 hypothetical protein [Microbulbifer thermotolerans]
MRNLILIGVLFFVSASAAAKEYWAYSKDGVNLIVGIGVRGGAVVVVDNHLGKEPIQFAANQLKFTLDNGRVESPCCVIFNRKGKLDLAVGAGSAAHYYLLNMPPALDPFDRQQILLTLRGDEDPWVAVLGGVGLSMEDAIAKLDPVKFYASIKEITLGSNIKFKRINEDKVIEILAPLRDL